MRVACRSACSYLDSVAIPIFDNDQDIPRLASARRGLCRGHAAAVRFLVRVTVSIGWEASGGSPPPSRKGLNSCSSELQRRLLEAK